MWTRKLHLWASLGIAITLTVGLVLGVQPAFAATTVTLDQSLVSTGEVLVVRAGGFDARGADCKLGIERTGYGLSNGTWLR